MARLRISALLAIFTAVCVSAQPQRDLAVERIVPRKQVALVIGNGAYVSVNKLVNPVNDADAMARQLKELNYDVLLVREASRRQMGEKIDEFIGRLGTGDVALFYYAGHGVQLDGENYLIPVDFKGTSESDVRYDAFPVGKIQDRMEHSGAQLNILVLDACRTNPFRFRSRGGTNGWAAMDAGRGTYIAFATAPNTVASDNSDAPNGLFTSYLLQALAEPGLGLDDVFNLVRARVDAASNRKQLPWTHSSVVGQYIFRPAAITGVSTSVSVDSSKFATSTGIVAAANQIFTITASGTVNLSSKDAYITDANGTIVRAPPKGSGGYNYFSNLAAPVRVAPVVGAKKLMIPPYVTYVANAPYGALLAGFSSKSNPIAFSDFSGFTLVGTGASIIAPSSGGYLFFAVNDWFPLNYLGSDDNTGSFTAIITSSNLTSSPPARGTAAGATQINSIDGLTYVWIPPGTFTMGCSPGDQECFKEEKPAHPVTITKGFWMGQTEVTQEAYQRVIGRNPSASSKGPKFPVENVSREEAQAYCFAIGGELPTEALWEYGARGSNPSSQYGPVGDTAWYRQNSGGKTQPVGQKKPNQYGLYDMSGNVWEWTADWFGDYQPSGTSDPPGPATGEGYVMRGGSWLSNPREVRVSRRFRVDPTKESKGSALGFRCKES